MTLLIKSTDNGKYQLCKLETEHINATSKAGEATISKTSSEYVFEGSLDACQEVAYRLSEAESRNTLATKQSINKTISAIETLIQSL